MLSTTHANSGRRAHYVLALVVGLVGLAVLSALILRAAGHSTESDSSGSERPSFRILVSSVEPAGR